MFKKLNKQAPTRYQQQLSWINNHQYITDIKMAAKGCHFLKIINLLF